jgi:UDP-glucose:glycoprotein glucosyltransferase
VKRTGVSGYGVELALKNTDYLVVDDRASTPASTGSAATSGASTHEYFRDTLGDDPWSELSTPLTKEELRGV